MNRHQMQKRQAIIWTKDGLFYWRIYASAAPNDLRKCLKMNRIIKHYGAETGKFRDDNLDTMAAGALDPCVARSSANVAFTV